MDSMHVIFCAAIDEQHIGRFNLRLVCRLWNREVIGEDIFRLGLFQNPSSYVLLWRLHYIRRDERVLTKLCSLFPNKYYLGALGGKAIIQLFCTKGDVEGFEFATRFIPEYKKPVIYSSCITDTLYSSVESEKALCIIQKMAPYFGSQTNRVKDFVFDCCFGYSTAPLCRSIVSKIRGLFTTVDLLKIAKECLVYLDQDFLDVVMEKIPEEKLDAADSFSELSMGVADYYIKNIRYFHRRPSDLKWINKFLYPVICRIYKKLRTKMCDPEKKYTRLAFFKLVCDLRYQNIAEVVIREERKPKLQRSMLGYLIPKAIENPNKYVRLSTSATTVIKNLDRELLIPVIFSVCKDYLKAAVVYFVGLNFTTGDQELQNQIYKVFVDDKELSDLLPFMVKLGFIENANPNKRQKTELSIC